MRMFQKLQAVTFAFLLRCGKIEEISSTSKQNDYFKGTLESPTTICAFTMQLPWLYNECN